MPLIFRIACSTSILLASLSAAADLRSEVQQYRLAHEAGIVGQIEALTRLKSIAADPAGLAATAQALNVALKSRGFEVALLSTGDNSPPAVFGWLKAPRAKRTVLFYAHYDGQPGRLPDRFRIRSDRRIWRPTGGLPSGDPNGCRGAALGLPGIGSG